MGVVIQDTFTVAATTQLVLHAPDIGTSWAEFFNDTSSSEFLINATSDDVAANSGQSGAGMGVVASPGPGIADYDVEITLAAIHSGSGSRPFHLFGRLLDEDNWYRLTFYRSDIGDPVVIAKCVAGVHTELVTYTGSGIANGDRWKFELVGAALKAYRDSGAGYVEILSTTDGDLTAAGQAGMGAGSVNLTGGHLATAWRVDDFVVTDTGVSAGVAGSLVSGIRLKSLVGGGLA